VLRGDSAVEGYQIYVGTGQQPFGRPLYDAMPATAMPAVIARLLHVYRQHRRTPDETFGAFADRYTMTALQRLLHTSQPDKPESHA
jgi:ferredoxin-nitrite reductase